MGNEAATRTRDAGARPLRVLMVTFPFPPMSGSSGVQRPTKLARFLASQGTAVTVLTCHPRAYEHASGALADSPSQEVRVLRAFAMDAARHLAIRGRYPRWLALPDRWASWIPAALVKGQAEIRRTRPDLIWSTYPIASAHVIAGLLARRHRIPWIADFRDPMFEEEYEQRGSVRARVIRRVDAFTARTCTLGVFTTPGTRELYAARYPDCPAEKWTVVENGFDESDFAAIPPVPRATRAGRPFRLLHSGVVYSFERDPRSLFNALGRLLARRALLPEDFQLCLRAPGDEPRLRRLLSEAGCEPLVQILPSISHRDAIAEMLSSDGLLVLQADNCNRQIPAKAYEYLRAGRPILALTDARGDTAGLLRPFARATLCSLADSAQIEACLPAFLERARSGAVNGASEPDVATFERDAQSAILLRQMERLRT